MSKRDQILISTFIIVYFFIIGIAITADCPLRQFVHQYTRGLELFFGVDQSWRMFCPNPRDFCFHPYAVITFQDGSTAYYEFPRPDKMSQFQALMRERVRKHFYDIMPWSDFSVFRPSIARYIARAYADPNNEPTQVSLCYNADDIGRLPKLIPHNHPLTGTKRNTFFVYQVRVEDIK